MAQDNINQNIVPKKSKRRLVSYIVLLLLIGFIVLLGVYVSDGLGSLTLPRDRVAVIYIQGPMIADNVPSGLGYASSEQICKELRDAKKDPFVRAIVLRVNSPGGTPAAAQEIVSEIKKTKEELPIVVSMGDLAASGAYYIAAPASKIVANPDTMTGSIGVVWVFENKEGYFHEEGLNYTIVKSGEFKDMGAPWRNLTAEEKEHATDVVMDSYDRFVNEVAEGRNMSVVNVEELSDGRIFLGENAKELGLVDEIGNLYDAIDIAAELGGISGSPEIVYKNQAPDLLGLLFGGDLMNYKNDEPIYEPSYQKENIYGRILWIYS